MEVLKCKMCGGELELTENASICRCKYCGSMQTLPREKSDIRVNAYNMANHLFRNNEYDKAMSIYEKILLEDPEDANAYWSCILCKYGVNYVEDPATGERKITVNRTQNEPVETDELYKSAIEYATADQKALFERDAKAINEIQRGILDISRNEKPFDIFISYKESDRNGERTVDSVLATDLYYGLTDAGYKVFLSRITLEDKLGREYEPYIYAALNSAKVMIVLGTKTEYFNAPWVKNEWSRYLKIIKNDRSKILIPAYRDIDPYDLPQEFALLQSQDMSKIGFLQDIIRGVKKVIVKDKKPVEKVIEKTVVKEAAGSPAASNEVQNLIQRIKIFIDGNDWANAGQYIERALDKAPLNPELYALKAQVNHKLKSIDDIIDSGLASDMNLNNAIKFADGEYKVRLENIRDNMEEHTRTAIERQKQRDAELAAEKRQKEEQDRVAREKREAYNKKYRQLNDRVGSLNSKINDLKDKKLDYVNEAKHALKTQTEGAKFLKKAFVSTIIAIVSLIVGIVVISVTPAIEMDSSLGGIIVPVGMIGILLAVIMEIRGKYNYMKYRGETSPGVSLILTLLGEYFSLGIYAIVLDVKIFSSKKNAAKNLNTANTRVCAYAKIDKGEQPTAAELKDTEIKDYYNNYNELIELREKQKTAKAELDAFLNSNSGLAVDAEKSKENDIFGI